MIRTITKGLLLFPGTVIFTAFSSISLTREIGAFTVPNHQRFSSLLRKFRRYIVYLDGPGMKERLQKHKERSNLRLTLVCPLIMIRVYYHMRFPVSISNKYTVRDFTQPRGR